ncbi:type IVB secretion system protein IcmH/DotU [Erwinia sp. B116]|uniref:type IVB secretion system protein IcmH/DotU n=1 Tax=Erwinia sp. B116 TaxID=1561024 RepID=UPI000C766AC3|nr:type IVB secretion system protein IcmH/DotU [Erwinia sp. B116]PLV58584.1 membrane protein [Erwinia sp. B116]
MTPELPASTAAVKVQDYRLLTAAAPLLNAIVQIRQAATHDDPAGLRQQLVDEIHQFEAVARQSGLPFETLIGARYCLCAVLDEAAAKTPWGSRGIWSGNGLLVTFHNESWGGEKVFQLLARLSQHPATHLELLEVIHYCLLLGFEGRYRGAEQGRQQREALRERLAQLIRDTRSRQAAAPMPAAEEPAIVRPRWQAPIPLWVCAACALLCGALVFSTLNWRLGKATEPVLQQIWQIPLPAALPGLRGNPSQTLQELQQRLSDLIDARQLDVTDSESGSKIILPADRLFVANSAELTAQGRALIARVAAALETAKGTLLVCAYTDDSPVEFSRFPTRWDYTQAQAHSAGTLLQQLLAQPGMTLRSEGRGDSHARLPNDSGENRAINRRLEIILQPAPDDGGNDSKNSGKS